MRPFRFAVQATRATSAREWYDLARKVEDLGFSTLFVTDHYLGPGPAARECSLPPQHLAPLSAMAAAAAVTSTLRIGCRVFCVDYHVPAALVKEATTIDLLSDGRLELGLGAGQQAPEYRSLGLPFLRGGERVDKLAEVVALFRAHWSGELIDIEGTHVKVTGYRGLPSPVQAPPPLMIGGGRERLLSYAAREADIVSIANVHFTPTNGAGRSPADEAAHRYGIVAHAAGERLASLEIEAAPAFAIVTDDSASAYADIAGWIGADPDLMAQHPSVLVGSLDAMADRLHHIRERFGTNYVTIPQASIDDLAPLVSRLTGG